MTRPDIDSICNSVAKAFASIGVELLSINGFMKAGEAGMSVSVCYVDPIFLTSKEAVLTLKKSSQTWRGFLPTEIADFVEELGKKKAWADGIKIVQIVPFNGGLWGLAENGSVWSMDESLDCWTLVNGCSQFHIQAVPGSPPWLPSVSRRPAQ